MSTNVSEPLTKEAVQNDPSVRLFDEEDDLQLYSYSDTRGDFSRNCRGLVFKDDSIVVQTYPHTPEYSIDDRDKMNERWGDGFDDSYTFFESHEGCIIRLFYINEKWFISTHKKLNAFESKWSSKKTFGEFFMDALENEYNVNKELNTLLGPTSDVFESFVTTLNTDYTYVFLLRNNTENRIVCDPPDSPTLYHVGTFRGDDFSLDEDIHIPYPVSLNFSSVDELLNHVENTDYSQLQGVVIFQDNILCKVLSSTYLEMFNLRGNESDVRNRYFQLRNDPSKTDQLYHLYPRFVELFDDCENTLLEIRKWIMDKYVDRFIKKQYVTVPRDEYNII